MKIETVDIQRLTPYEKNPRDFIGPEEETIKKIASSIKSFGITQPIVCNQDYVTCIGHTRFKAMQSLGIKKVPVLKLTLNEDKFKALNIADNKAHEFTAWDFDKLYKSVSELPQALKEITLFDIDELVDTTLISDLAPTVETEEDSQEAEEEGEEESEAPLTGNKEDATFITLVYSKEDATEFRECIKDIRESFHGISKEEVILKLLKREREDPT